MSTDTKALIGRVASELEAAGACEAQVFGPAVGRSFYAGIKNSFQRAAVLFACVSCAFAAEDRRERVLKDRAEFQTDAHWIYNDLPKAISEAARTRKPMLVVFRCIP